MEMLIILGFVIFAVFSIFGAISMIKQINKLPNMGTLGSKPKTQTDYANEHKKPNPKQFNGIKTEEPFVKTRKRKPKTTKEWEDEFDLGGHE
jgi:hypothetical protein